MSVDQSVHTAQTQVSSVGTVSTDAIVQGDASCLPVNILEALAERVRNGMADPNLALAVKQLKEERVSERNKNDICKAICTSLLEKKRDPDLEKILLWMEKNPHRHLQVGDAIQGVVFSAVGESSPQQEMSKDCCPKAKGCKLPRSNSGCISSLLPYDSRAPNDKKTKQRLLDAIRQGD